MVTPTLSKLIEAARQSERTLVHQLTKVRQVLQTLQGTPRTPASSAEPTKPRTTTAIGQETAERMLALLGKSPKMIQQIVSTLKLSESGAYGCLNRLRKRGLVENRGGLWGLVRTPKTLRPAKTKAVRGARSIRRRTTVAADDGAPLHIAKKSLNPALQRVPGQDMGATRKAAIIKLLQAHPEPASARAINFQLRMAPSYLCVYPYLKQLAAEGLVVQQGGAWRATANGDGA